MSSPIRAPVPVDVAVVGGGISGLAAAWNLGRLTAEGGAGVHLIESASRLGGLIRTERVDGLILEGGPDSLVTYKPEGLELCRALGLSDELIRPAQRSTVFEILLRGRLVGVSRELATISPARLAPLLTTRLFSWRGKLRLAAEPFISRGRPVADESLREFIERRFGREAFRRLAEPVIGGLFTADADRLSAEAAIGRLRALERDHGSVHRGLAASAARRRPGRNDAALVALSGGMQRLVERLTERLPADAVSTGARVSELRRDPGSGRWVLAATDGRAWSARSVILASPAYVAAELLREVRPELARELDTLEYASCATVNLVYEARRIRRPPRSFGFFVPRTEGLPILACSQVSARFPGRAPNGRVLMRAFLGGARDPEMANVPEDRLAELAHDSLRRVLDIRGEPLLARATRSPASMPQQNVGHPERVARIERGLEHLPGLYLGGSAIGAVGIPDCVRLGRQAAEKAHDHLAHGCRRLELAI